MFKRTAALVIATLAVTALFPAAVHAQQFAVQPVEIFIGAGFVRYDVDNEVGEDIPSQTAAGLQVDATYYVQEYFGIVGEVGWIDTDVELPESFDPVRRLTGSQISFMVGGRFRWLAGERFQIRAHSLIGAARQDARADVGVGLDIPELTGTAFAFSAGVSFDIAFHDDFAIRIQPDLLLTAHENNPSTSFRMAFGVVF